MKCENCGSGKFMDSIEVKNENTPYCCNEHLCIFINGIRLDIILSDVDENYFGLVPSLLNWYDESSLSSIKEKQYIWSQAKLESGIKILPILLCPDDFDFSCTTIVVEVIDNNKTVSWSRFGVDITEFSADEVDLPKYIGKKVNWFTKIKPFVFLKNEYSDCIKLFEANLSL